MLLACLDLGSGDEHTCSVIHGRVTPRLPGSGAEHACPLLPCHVHVLRINMHLRSGDCFEGRCWQVRHVLELSLEVAIAYRCSYIFCECKLFLKHSTNIRKAHETTSALTDRCSRTHSLATCMRSTQFRNTTLLCNPLPRGCRHTSLLMLLFQTSAASIWLKVQTEAPFRQGFRSGDCCRSISLQKTPEKNALNKKHAH